MRPLKLNTISIKNINHTLDNTNNDFPRLLPLNPLSVCARARALFVCSWREGAGVSNHILGRNGENEKIPKNEIKQGLPRFLSNFIEAIHVIFLSYHIIFSAFSSPSFSLFIFLFLFWCPSSSFFLSCFLFLFLFFFFGFSLFLSTLLHLKPCYNR